MKKAIDLRMGFFSAMAHEAMTGHGFQVSEIAILFFDMKSDWSHLAWMLNKSIPDENEFTCCVVPLSALKQILSEMPEVLRVIKANPSNGNALLLGLSDEVIVSHVKVTPHPTNLH